MDRLRVDALPHRALLGWLRERLSEAANPALLHVVLLAYDAGRNLEHLANAALEDPALPHVVVARYPAHWAAEGGGLPQLKGTPKGKATLQSWLISQPLADLAPVRCGPMVSTMTRGRYDEAIEGILDGIAAGDYYEINLARRLQARFDARDTLALYLKLRQLSQPRHGALWALDPRTWLASASPECLLTWNPATRRAHSFPIKGTRPRGATPVDDDALARELSGSTKDRAEHLMIVDLVRNDLGRIAEHGSVTVDDLFGVHRLGAVQHMISDVSATARPEYDLVDVLAALFPGGSITGAPKIAAMDAIERAEGLKRGFYCGSLGVIDDGGRAVFNILIRTAVAAGGRLLYQTGGAIVADSSAEQEWAETKVKAAALMQALND